MLDLLLSMNPDATLAFDENGTIIGSNQASVDLFGYSIDELLYKPLSLLLPRQEVEKHAHLFREFTTDSSEIRKMGMFRTAFGQHSRGYEIPIDVSIGKSMHEGKTILIAVIRAADAEKRAEEKVRSVALFPTENPEPVFRIKGSGEILFANPRGEKLLQFIIPASRNLAPEEWRNIATCVLEKNIQQVEKFGYGSRVYAFTFVPILEMGYVNIYGRDITESEFEKAQLALSDEILRSIGNLVLVADGQARIIYISPSAKDILGYEPEELMGEGWWNMERVSGGNVEAEKDYIRKAAAGLIKVDKKPYEHLVRHKDGSWRWLMLADTKGPRDFIIGIGTDFTNIKKAEEELQNQRDFAQTLTTQMGQGLTVTDENNCFTFVNPSYAKLLGYAPENLIGKTPYDVTYPEAHPTLRAALDKRLRGEITNYEIHLQGKDHHEAFVLVTAVPRMISGKYNGAIAVITDLTERRRIENTLRENEETIRSLYEITSSEEDFAQKVHDLLRLGIQRFDLPIGILSNIQGEQYTVISAETPDDSIKTGDVFPLGKTYCRDTIKASRPIGFQSAHDTKWAKHPCYQAFHLEAYLGVPVFVAGQIYGTLNFSSPTALDQEITETDQDLIQLMALWIGQEINRLQAEQKLRRYAAEIQQKNTDLAEARDRALEASYLKSAFLAMVSHEIRTPMNAILGMGELLLDTSLDQEQREFAGIIDSSARHLLGILNDILDFSKLEAGKFLIHSTDFSLVDLAQETIKLFRSKASAKNITLDLALSPAIPEILVGDCGRLRQVLGNVVSNAVKFTEDGGRVSVNLDGMPTDENSMAVTFTVQDNGIGIPAQVQTKLFEPFMQADVSTTRKYGGTGLGLAISSRLVDMMGGEMGFRSIEGAGSVFWFTVPLVKRSPEISCNQKSGDDIFLGEKKYKGFSEKKPVLVVEDNPTNQDLFTAQLGKLGLTTRTVSNGEEAVDLLELDPGSFSLILMELHMPKMDGISVTRRIRQSEASTKTHIPIIALTADARTGSQELCLNAGMDDFLSKPVSLANLNNVLTKWLKDA